MAAAMMATAQADCLSIRDYDRRQACLAEERRDPAGCTSIRALAILAGNDAVSIMLDLMQPLRAGRSDLGEHRNTRGNKAGRTAPTPSGSRPSPHDPTVASQLMSRGRPPST